MRIVVIDKRKGTELREEHRELLGKAEVVLEVTADLVKNVTKDYPLSKGQGGRRVFEIEVINAVHRDTLSGEMSAEARDKQLAKLDEIEGEDPLVKFSRVWEGESNSGTEQITGQL